MPKAAPVQPTTVRSSISHFWRLASDSPWLRAVAAMPLQFFCYGRIPAHEVWLNATRLALGFLPCIGVWEVSGRSDRSVSTNRIDPPARGSLPRQGTRRGARTMRSGRHMRLFETMRSWIHPAAGHWAAACSPMAGRHPWFWRVDPLKLDAGWWQPG